MAIVGDRIEHRTFKDGKATITDVDTLRSTYTVEWDHPKGLKREISFQEYALHWKLITSADKVNDLIDSGKITISTTPAGNNPFYKYWYSDRATDIGTDPESIKPGIGEEITLCPDGGLVLPDKHCLHTWREVLLLTSTVTECSKCGVLRE